MSDNSSKSDKPGSTAGKDGTTTTTTHPAGGTRPARSLTTARVRTTLARVVWLACLLIALVLAGAAFSFALGANPANPLVSAVRDLADVFDVGLFDLDEPVWAAETSEPNHETKTALANYGVAAVCYLVLGRLLERIVRP